MRVLKVLAAMALILVLGGCLTPSIHPLYTDGDLVFDPALVGAWSDDEDVWAFEAEDEDGYRLTITEDEEVARLSAHLVQLGDHRFLDLYPEDPECENCWYYFHMLPVHTFCRVSVQGDALEMAFVDGEWLKEKSEAGELGLRHEYRDDQVILTASTTELQEYILSHLDQVFGDDGPEVLHRGDSNISVIRAVRESQVDSLRSLLAAGGDVDERDGLLHTPLIWAAREGKKSQIAEVLIGHGADLEAADLEGRTALIWSARTGKRKMAALLLKAGASPEARDSVGQTPLMWAARKGHRTTVEALLAAGADASARDSYGLTAVARALMNGHMAVVELLGTGEKAE